MNEFDFSDLRERFTLVRMQVANWGTFSNIHDIHISDRGHLFVGGSGSGKSTLLDAVSALLSPKASYFNAAARQGERRSDRSFVSYIRGAWSSEQDKDGRAATKYLREGPTFSLIALTFASEQQTVTLLFIGYIQGKSKDESDVRKRYFVIREPFEIAQLADFGKQGFDLKIVKQRFPTAKSFPTFAAYSESFMQTFGIGSTKVLDLLHKAQSAKNMGDINRFFRDFMLGEPVTFSIAENLVENFSRLKEAYESVKTARRQHDVLSQAKASFDKAEKAKASLVENNLLRQEVYPWRLTLTRGFLEEKLPELEAKCAETDQRLNQAAAEESSSRRKLEDLKRERYESGGDKIERLTSDLKHAESRLSSATRSVQKLLSSFDKLGLNKPRSLNGWIALQKETSRKSEEAEEKGRALRGEEEELVFTLRGAQEQFRGLSKEIEAMKKHPSNIPAELLKLRDDMLRELNLSLEDLPFVGELMEIKEDEAQWQGAAERVLHQFASSLLVRERHYPILARYVDRTYLGLKLVYHRVVNQFPAAKELDQNFLPEKFNLKQGQWSQWLRSELSRRFDYQCVESTAEFAGCFKAVTLKGQVKHNEVRHEKDDRRTIFDRKYWITGFSNEKKRLQYEDSARELAALIAEKTSRRNAIRDELEEADAVRRACQRILDTDWTQIDEGSPQAEIADIKSRLEKIERSSEKLSLLSERIAETEKELRSAEDLKAQWTLKKGERDAELKRLKNELQAAVQALSGLTVHKTLHGKLVALAAELDPKPMKRDRIEIVERGLNEYFQGKGEEFNKIQLTSENEVCNLFASFKAEWPTEASELMADLESAPEFFQKLEVLEKDGLPKFEQKFRDILENNTKQHLINLFREIDQERRDIKARMREVNESLADAVFNRSSEGDSHLIIDVKDLRLPEYEDFKKEQSLIVASDTQRMSLNQAKDYYRSLEELVKKLDARVPDYAIWRSKVLDAREHVSFQGREVNDREETLDIYDSGVGKSGGQRQKLTLTCLVAALRYQLGGHKGEQPSFAPIIMDEAFDKADNEFTDISMKIFKDFGFQPIVATPLKGLLTLEPYMGSFAQVSCENRKVSRVISVSMERVKEIIRGEAT
ncbi:SbcC/MukB-like Walker B domain-containing protein [uncultured Parasutterella sp.]|jgi:uncharacterized protein YPO0396|uniref:ATP-binding protein n=1 Tax=uncultured Parasutterella sp. TaxID=1263098 RepID=UPI0025E73712|nr:SbcC/MukB-like Walker B domain-containing protein [uncultured Parasutterella sp.]